MAEWLNANDPQARLRAAEVIRDGGLIILPTDTVYGVGTNLWNPEAVAALYRAKQRFPEKAIPILLADITDIAQVAVNVPEIALQLAAVFWPGPLTIAVPKRLNVPEIVSTLPTVGVRIPDHPAARTIIRACGGALAVSSANRSGEDSPLTAHEAADALGDHVALVIDGGRCRGGVPSTVVDVSRHNLHMVRPGPISEADLRRVLGTAQ